MIPWVATFSLARSTPGVDEHGDGPPLVLLHPGGADARAWAPNLAPLANHFHVYTPERRGQGRTPDVAGPITHELMAQDTIAFLEQVVGAVLHISWGTAPARTWRWWSPCADLTSPAAWS